MDSRNVFRATRSRAATVGVLLVAAPLYACNTTRGTLPAAPETAGRAVSVDNTGLPPGHTVFPEMPVGDPAGGMNHIGRAPRRLNVDQLRTSLLNATGFTWVARRTVSDPDAPGGSRVDPEADMLEALAPTLGRPDFVTSTNESIEPAVPFTKLAGDAARAACRASINADIQIGALQSRRLLRYVETTDTLEANNTAVRQNLSYLALRFWGRDIAPGDPQLEPLVRLFGRASTADRGNTAMAAATPVDGWRAVCIAMATDPQFLTY